MTKAIKRIYIVILAILLFAITLVPNFGASVSYAAEETQYSNVLDDLKKDESFSESYYTEKSNDYTLQVIQIAESSDKELFVYVYQPSGQTKALTASSINISTEPKWNIEPHNYTLQLLNSNGTLFKYKVNGFSVSNEETRYYGIISIFRPFDKNLGDSEADHDNAVNEVPFEVAKQYCFSKINGQPYVAVTDIETIIVTDKFVGFVRYKDGYKLYVGACDNHFVAFNTDKPIDKLLEADVSYETQSYTWSSTPGLGVSVTKGDPSIEEAKLSYTDDTVVHNGGGLFAATYKWDTIETVEQFIAGNEKMENVYTGAVIDVNVANTITDEGKEALRGKKWVLRFTTTKYELSGSATGHTRESSTLVGNVTILRLKFETDGQVYNLGVVDNKQTSNDKPINEEQSQVTVTSEAKPWLLILGLLSLLVLLYLLAPIIKPIVSAIVWLVTAPFKAIGKRIKKKKE